MHLPPRIQYHIFLICTLLYSTNCSFIFYTLQQTINQIDGWSVVIKFNENGFSLENLVEEYIKEKFSVY